MHMTYHLQIRETKHAGPTGLEIVSWEPKQGNRRNVRFRCARVGVKPSGIQFNPLAPPSKGGDIVSLEDAGITYEGDRIKSVYCAHSYQIWNAR
jgi:hypothetical protein